MSKQALRHLPSVERLKSAILRDHPAWPGELATLLARDVIDAVRETLADGSAIGKPAVEQRIARELEAARAVLLRPSLRRVLNGTGVLIHTNAGRAPLSSGALAAIASTSSAYCNLELQLADGQRGSRHDHLRPLLRWACGAEDGLVVNNNAAAVMLALHALAKGRPVLVSRGELVEIGGSFRIPDVMAAAGVRLIEVGTTNRTWIADYERAARSLIAAGDPPAALMQVHRSNFRMQGFVATPTVAELAALAGELDIPLLSDLGAGALHDPAHDGLASEPTVAETLADGADIATFSGDKLIGGPQAGIAVGKKRWIAMLRSDPMARAVRVDAITLAALDHTMRAHLLGTARRSVPVVRAVTRSIAELETAAERLLAGLLTIDGVRATSKPSTARLGGGSQPQEELPSLAVEVAVAGCSPNKLARLLRNADVPVLVRTRDDHVAIDVRSLLCAAAGADPVAELLRSAEEVLVRPAKIDSTDHAS